jgi:hypothetical protein
MNHFLGVEMKCVLVVWRCSVALWGKIRLHLEMEPLMGVEMCSNLWRRNVASWAKIRLQLEMNPLAGVEMCSNREGVMSHRELRSDCSWAMNRVWGVKIEGAMLHRELSSNCIYHQFLGVGNVIYLWRCNIVVSWTNEYKIYSSGLLGSLTKFQLLLMHDMHRGPCSRWWIGHLYSWSCTT